MRTEEKEDGRGLRGKHSGGSVELKRRGLRRKRRRRMTGEKED